MEKKITKKILFIMAHRLQHQWAIWILIHEENVSWEDQVHLFQKITTVEEFWKFVISLLSFSAFVPSIIASSFWFFIRSCSCIFICLFSFVLDTLNLLKTSRKSPTCTFSEMESSPCGKMHRTRTAQTWRLKLPKIRFWINRTNVVH